MSKLIAAAITAALLLSPVTAAAHTDDQLDMWTVNWEHTAKIAGFPDDLDAEYEDYANRHPRYFGRLAPIATHTHPIAPQPSVVGSSVEQWRSLVETHFRAADVERALRIMRCESGGDPNIMHDFSNPASASGLMQHLGKYWPARSAAAGYAGASIFDPTANVAVAAWLRDQPGGWSHWRACL